MARGARGHIVADSGSLAMVTAASVGVGTTPRSVCIPTGGAHVYVTLSGTSMLAQYTRDTGSGALTAFGTRDIAAGNTVAYVAASPDGTSIYTTAAGSYRLYYFQRNTSTGVLTAGGSLALDGAPPAGQYPQGLVISPDGLFIYIACRNPGGTASVMQLSRNTSTGVPALLTPTNVSTGSGIQSMGIAMTALDNGVTVYVGNFNGDSISLFTRNTTTGLLIAHATQPTIATGSGTNPCWIAISPDDKHLYIALDSTAQVGAYTINAGDGSLTLIAKYSTSNGPFSCVVSPDGLSVYLGNSDGQTISQYSRNASTGVLTPKSPALVRSDPTFTSQTGSAGPQSISISPDGKSMYATGSISPNYIAQFRVNP